MFSLVRYGPLWPCSLRGRSRARVLDIPPRHFLADFTDSAYRGGVEAWAIHPMRATARRSAALTPLPLPDQLLDRARQSRLEVDQLRQRRGHDDPDHAVAVERTHLRLPLDPLLGRHLVGAVHVEELLGNALDDVQLGPTPG